MRKIKIFLHFIAINCDVSTTYNSNQLQDINTLLAFGILNS